MQNGARDVSPTLYPMSVSHRNYQGTQNETFWEELGHVKNINCSSVGLVDVSKTTLYRDLKENKLSATTDVRGKKVIDTAELERFYGKLKSPPGVVVGNNGNSQSDTMEQNGTPETEQPSASCEKEGALARIF